VRRNRRLGGSRAKKNNTGEGIAGCGSPDFAAQRRNGACPALAGESEGSCAKKSGSL